MPEQSSPDTVNQDSQTVAVSASQEDFHEKLPSTENTCQQNSTSQPQTEMQNGEQCHDSDESTMDLMALTSHQSTNEECRSESPLAKIDVNIICPSNACCSEQASENSNPIEGREDAKHTFNMETVKTECIIIEETFDSTSAEEQGDIQSNQEMKLSDGTDVSVSGEI